MRYLIITLLACGSICLASRPTTRPTLEQLRPHYSGPVMICPARSAETQVDPNANHYLYAQPSAGWYWGCGWPWLCNWPQYP